MLTNALANLAFFFGADGDAGCTFCGLRGKKLDESSHMSFPLVEHIEGRGKPNEIPINFKRVGSNSAISRTLAASRSVSAQLIGFDDREVAKHHEKRPQEDETSSVSSDGSYNDQMLKCRDELRVMLKRESRTVPDTSPVRQRFIQFDSSDRPVEVKPSHGPPAVKLASGMQPRQGAVNNNRSIAADDDDEDNGMGESDRVERAYQRAGAREHCQYLRKVMNTNGRGLPNDQYARNRWNTRHPTGYRQKVLAQEVEDFQAVMQDKIARLGATSESARYLTTASPSIAVCNALTNYHGVCNNVGVMFAEPGDIPDDPTLSQKQKDELFMWQRQLQGDDSTEFSRLMDSPSVVSL